MPRRPRTDEQTTTIVVEARDLDTDERARESRTVEPPFEAALQRTALVEAVRETYPSARIRSFADGAATFLDRQHLIVAWFEALPRTRRSEDPPQEPLFAA